MPIVFFLALRFLSSSSEKTISLMAKICFFSIAIGAFALTLVAAIMNGFEKATHDKLQSIHSDVIIQARGQALNIEKINNVLNTEFKNQIFAFSPQSINHALIKKVKNKVEQTNLIELRAINPETESQVNALKNMLISYDKNTCWSQLLDNNSVFIGQSLAEQLQVSVGDSVNLLFQPEEEATNKITLTSQKVKIAAIFKTGIHEFDEHIVYCSFDLFNKLFNIGITQISIKLKCPKQEKLIIEALQERLSGLEVYSWKDLYPALVSALTLEKYAMIIILALVTLVASMNIISLLFMYITQKKGEIALLKSLSMVDDKLIKVFLTIGMTIALSASAIGIIFASVASWLLKNYPIIKLPDAYYVTYLPAELDWPLIILVLSVVVVVSFLATLLPAYKTKYINIAQVLKNS